MDRATATDTAHTRRALSAPAPAGSHTLAPEFAVLPASAPHIIRNNTIAIHAAAKVQSLDEAERGRRFQQLVLRCTPARPAHGRPS